MPLDLDGIAPSARARLVSVGKNYGSLSTLAQANQTLNGLAAHGARLARAGFSAEDAQRLLDARDALVEAGVGREATRTARKQTSHAYVAATKDAKAVRLRARAIAIRVVEVLEDVGDEPSLAAARSVVAELERTSVAPRQAEPLANQLERLGTLFSDPAVAAAGEGRGAVEVATDAAAKATALRSVAAERATAAGTPEASERLDLIDGVIAHLARAARRAARAVAKEEGEPALAALFDLGHLDGGGSARAVGQAPVEPEPVGA
jgi:hypothetical protein